ncbi:sensor histidine kinase [Sporosarcina beigongshangi]|uniref:sensor histidine kinase n=1 Tax=Sporosarcina beigongshangi TaxID=2782538 RepID=UPI00193A0646|nr:sensor histidine kinase [Sporosarcina beigongshangi]
MKDSTLEQLCSLYTELTEEDIRILKNTASTLQMYADLSDAYMFIDCKMKDSENAIVVAEAFPKSVESVYENSVVGKIVFDTFEPGVFYSYRQGKKSVIRQAVTQEGRSVEQSVVPIKNDLHQVIGVLIQEKEVDYPAANQNNQQKDSLGQGSIDYVMGDNSNDMPMVSDLLMEIFLLTDNENKLIYANPVGVKFITEMSRTEEIQNRNLVELLPFLNPVYNQQDDVFVFELTVDHKNLVVKKVRLRKKDKMRGTLLIIQDLTELRTKEKELMMKSVVIQEIHHRVKNNLQTVASLLRLQMRRGFPEESRSYFEDTLNRIFSISSVYELILANEDAEDDDVNIVELTRKVCSTMVVNELHKKVNLIISSNGNRILTSSRKAVSIALIVNELVQNSLKHAFPEDVQGEIVVDFLSNKDFLELHIFDNGVGMREPKTSLGLEIVHNLVVNDLNGEFSYLPENIGTHAVITFPVSPEVIIYYEKENTDS